MMVVLRYGWHGRAAAETAMLDIIREDTYKEYTATVLSALGKMMSKNWPIPPYRETVAWWRPEPTVQDDRSAADVKADILKRLGEVRR